MMITPPSNSTFGASFASVMTGDYGDGSLTAFPSGPALINNGKLELVGNAFVTYTAIQNAQFTQLGAVKFKLTPLYTGSPADQQSFFSIVEDKAVTDVTNAIWITHESGGALRLYIFDSSDTLVLSASLGNWAAVASLEYEFEVNYNLNSGAVRMFIQGVQFGSTQSAICTRTSAVAHMQIGKWIGSAYVQNFRIRDLEIFNAVQHVADYTPGYLFPEDIPDPEPEPEPEPEPTAIDFYNEIFDFIGTTSLTDEEFTSMDITVMAYTQEVYDALLGVLDDREAVSTTRDRLTDYFTARGVDVVESSAGKSNIYLGDALC